MLEIVKTKLLIQENDFMVQGSLNIFNYLLLLLDAQKSVVFLCIGNEFYRKRLAQTHSNISHKIYFILKNLLHNTIPLLSS